MQQPTRPFREGFQVIEETAAPAVEPAEPPPEPKPPPEPAPAAERPKRAAPPPEIEPSPADLPPLPADEWPITVKLLYKPIRNPVTGQEMREVKIREPRAGDINRYGNPVRVNRDDEVIIEERKMTYIIAALTELLPPVIETMDPRDWNSVAYRLRRFFLPDPAAW